MTASHGVPSTANETFLCAVANSEGKVMASTLMSALNAFGEVSEPTELTIDGPLLIFGGCYSNLEATLAVQAEAERLGIPPERTICTGDVVAYGADAAATVAAIRDWNIRVIMGNCEESLAWRRTDCGCGFAEGSICAELSAAWYAHADAELDDADRAWMRTLPRRLYVRIGSRRLAIVHGAVDRINAFVFASTPWDEKARQIAVVHCNGVIGGHAGLPFTQIVAGKLWHNTGAIGMPANDGTRRVWYSVLAPTVDGIAVRSLPLEYDAGRAARQMRACGLPESYAAALEDGLWPSCDVLPYAELSARGRALAPHDRLWSDATDDLPYTPVAPAPPKFSDPELTASGEPRATVNLRALETVWFNTGTLCNIACENCYIESSPRNDRLVYLHRAEVRRFLDEAAQRSLPPSEIGFTGGEPFMNPEFLGMIEDSLAAGFRVLVLTNAMKPMQRRQAALAALNRRFPARMTIRVSLDHYTAAGHEQVRGAQTWQPTIDGLLWLAGNGFDLAIAGRMLWKESESELRAGYKALFGKLDLAIDADDPAQLVLFPEMQSDKDVPEITSHCWSLLGKSPDSVMCSNARMIIKRQGAAQPAVVSCTLLPYDQAFELGATLAEATGPVRLNHRYCAQFCVLGGASCSVHR